MISAASIAHKRKTGCEEFDPLLFLRHIASRSGAVHFSCLLQTSLAAVCNISFPLSTLCRRSTP